MGGLYILIRTFPFWALPLGLFFLIAFARKKTRPKGKSAIFMIVFSTSLLTGSVIFLLKRGHVNAVPFFHEVFTGVRTAPR